MKRRVDGKQGERNMGKCFRERERSGGKKKLPRWKKMKSGEKGRKIGKRGVVIGGETSRRKNKSGGSDKKMGK